MGGTKHPSSLHDRKMREDHGGRPAARAERQEGGESGQQDRHIFDERHTGKRTGKGGRQEPSD